MTQPSSFRLSRGLGNPNKFGQIQELINDNYSDIKLYSNFHIGFKAIAFIVLIALSRCNRVFTRRLRLCHSHSDTVYRREVRKGDREGPNRVESEV